MHVLIVGGAGFIGAHCAHQLAKAGHKVSIVDDFSFPPFGQQSGLEGEELRFRVRSLTSKATIFRMSIRSLNVAMFARGASLPDTVLHLAGLSVVGHAEKNAELAREAIVGDTRRVIEWALKIPNIRRIVYVSSSMVYGTFSREPIPESGETRPLGLYGQLKLEAEGLLSNALHKTGLEAVVVRPSAVYGPGEVNRRVVHTFCSRALAGDPLQINSGADQRMDFSYVTDTATGLCLAATHPAAAGETFNITYGQSRTLDELAALVARYAGPVQIRRVAQHDTTSGRRGALDISKARRLLGYRPTVDLEAGLALYFRHLAHQREIAIKVQSQ